MLLRPRLYGNRVTVLLDRSLAERSLRAFTFTISPHIIGIEELPRERTHLAAQAYCLKHTSTSSGVAR